MEGTIEKMKAAVQKNGAVLLVLLLGLGLMLWPQKKTAQAQTPSQAQQQTRTLEERLEDILSRVSGAGSTRVLLSTDLGEKTVYQSDETQSTQPDRQEKKTSTVLVSDAGRQTSGLVLQTEAPTYRGAVVVCQGGDDPQVKLAVVEAVARATGLPTNQIVVLKMK